MSMMKPRIVLKTYDHHIAKGTTDDARVTDIFSYRGWSELAFEKENSLH